MFKLRIDRSTPAHVHATLFAGEEGKTFANLGKLTMTRAESVLLERALRLLDEASKEAGDTKRIDWLEQSVLGSGSRSAFMKSIFITNGDRDGEVMLDVKMEGVTRGIGLRGAIDKTMQPSDES